MKFSIVVPVYNVYKYISKCLDSILNQEYDNYEIIIVNDGSKDNSQEIIDKYKKKFPDKIKCFKKENGGLSSARNYGINHVTGDYILFLDSDDYIDKNLLKKLNEILSNKKYDTIKFLFTLVDEDGKIIKKETSNINGEVNFEKALTLEYANAACCYAFKSDFWKKNKLEFPISKLHEDFGIIPLVLLLSSSIYILDYNGYNYLMREQSITNDNTKNLARANDMLFHYDNLLDKVKKYNIKEYDLKLFKSYIANGVINITRILDKKSFNEYVDIINKKNICDNLLDDTFRRKIKKFLIKLNGKIFIKLFNK